MNRSYTANDGSSRDETCFVEVDAFGRSAENVAKYFTKGKPILIEGRLRQDSWEDKQTGQKRTKLMVVLDRFEFVGGRDGGGSWQGASGGSQQSPYDDASPAPRRSQQGAPRVRDDLEDDDVPF